MATLCKLLEEVALKFGSKTALLTQCGYRIERWNYKYLWEFSECLAAYLQGKGFQRGDRLLLRVLNMPEWVALYFGGGGEHFRNWLEQCQELGEVEVEEVDTKGFKCFEEDGGKLYRIWMKVGGESPIADLEIE